MQTDVVNPLALQGPPSWPSSGSSFCAFDDMDFMGPSDYTNAAFDDGSPVFSGGRPLGCIASSPFIEPKGEYDDISQFLNPNPTEITSI